MPKTLEERADAADGRHPALDACPETAAIHLERAKLDAGEPWCVTTLAGLQFYDYDTPGLDDAPLRPQAGDRLTLTRRPDNRADANAIEVWWRNEHMLGHLPRDLAARLAPYLDRDASLRAYALGPGTGRAWSVRALLVGTPVAEDHGDWLRWQARTAEKELRRIARAAKAVHKARGAAFARRQEWARLGRLAQAVRAFERVPLDQALVPAVGEAHEASSLAEHLGMSQDRLSRLALAAGVRQVVRSRRRPPARPHDVVVTPALRDTLLAWCAAPATRATPMALAEAVTEAVTVRPPGWQDRDRPRGSTPDADEWRPLRLGRDG